MADINAKQDGNQQFTLVGISGTLGPTYGTAQVRPITVTDDGKINVNSSASLTVGTIAEITNLVGGTVGSVLGVGGVVQVSGTVVTGGAGTQPTRIIDGTVTNVGTLVGVGTVTNLGSVTNAGTVKEVTTVPTVTTVSNLTNGSVNILTGTINSATVSGDIASGSADSGNPVKVAGKFNNTLPTFLDGQRGDIQLGSRGAMRVQLTAANSASNITALSDGSDAVGSSATSDKIAVVSRNTVFNGASWDRLYGDATSGMYVQLKGSGGTVQNLISGTVNSGTVTIQNVAGLFPANAALADNISNPTTTLVGANNLAWNQSTWERLQTQSGNGDSQTGTGALRVVPNLLVNETNYARQRGNSSLTYLSSASRTIGTNTQGDQTNANYRGIRVIVSLTTVTSAPGTLIPRVEGKTASGVYYTLFTGTTITGVGTYIFDVYPGIANFSNVGTSYALPATYRIVVPQTNGTLTYAVDWDTFI